MPRLPPPLRLSRTYSRSRSPAPRSSLAGVTPAELQKLLLLLPYRLETFVARDRYQPTYLPTYLSTYLPILPPPTPTYLPLPTSPRAQSRAPLSGDFSSYRGEFIGRGIRSRRLYQPSRVAGGAGCSGERTNERLFLDFEPSLGFR